MVLANHKPCGMNEKSERSFVCQVISVEVVNHETDQTIDIFRPFRTKMEFKQNLIFFKEIRVWFRYRNINNVCMSDARWAYYTQIEEQIATHKLRRNQPTYFLIYVVSSIEWCLQPLMMTSNHRQNWFGNQINWFLDNLSAVPFFYYFTLGEG